MSFADAGLWIPSLLALALLVAHSARALPRREATLFWFGILAYGWVRHHAISWITEDVLAGRFPYRIERPRVTLLGVPPQEIAGWAIAVYLAWWLAERLAVARERAPAWGSTVAGAALALAATSWAVETAAGAAGWWRWSIALGPEWLHGVPAIGLVDWACVAADFLVPFLVWTSRPAFGLAARLASLALFPLHFGAHAFTESFLGDFTATDLAHAALLAAALVLALGSWRAESRFDLPAQAPLVWLALALVLGTAVAADLFVAREPLRLTSLLPLVALCWAGRSPKSSTSLAIVAIVACALGFLHHPSWFPGAVCAAVTAALGSIRKPLSWRIAVPSAVVVASLLMALPVRAAADGDARLRAGLRVALEARDRGELAAALAHLDELGRLFPRAPAPPSFAGEIRYRLGRLDEAEKSFRDSIARQLHPRPARYLAVLALRQGDRARAARWSATGLAVAPGDSELEMLAALSRGESWSLPRETDAPSAAGLAALAFEVGDVVAARAIVASALTHHPSDRRLHDLAVKLALAKGDLEAAREAARAWQRALPSDGEPARRLASWRAP